MHQTQQNYVEEYLMQFDLAPTESPLLSAEKFFKRQMIPQEVVLLHRVVKKINKRNREQDRGLVITNEFIYNLAGKQIKRKIALSKIYAVTISRTSSEFIVHVPDEYDYRYKSLEQKDLILYYLCIAFKLKVQEPLKFFIIDDEDLSQYTMNEKNSNREKQFALHPKQQPLQMIPDNFQLSYINQMCDSKIQVLYVRNPQLLSVSLQDFPKSVIIGQGSLCKIYLVNQKRPTQQLLAVKTISRNEQDFDLDLMEFLLRNYQVEPFISTLELCIQQKEKIHFFFKFMRAGDLYQHLREVNSFNEAQAKLIFSQIAYGLSSLHERGIIYGDLKPENVLMNERGYVALTDFGYGKLRIYHEYKKNKKLNLTLEYCAPEYLKNGDLTRMADWYSLGILLYELLVGIPPFYHPTSHQLTLKMILKGEVHFPKNLHCSTECKDMIMKLLQQDTSNRLGFSSDFKEIQQHPWLQDINWMDLRAKRMELPYQPNISEQQINESYFNMEQLQEEDRNW